MSDDTTVETSTANAPAAPRRRRRAVAPAGSPGQVTPQAVPATETPVTQQAALATEGPAGPQAPIAEVPAEPEAPSRPRRRRAGGAATGGEAAPAAESPAADEPGAATSATDSTAAEGSTSARGSRSTSKGRKGATAPEDAADAASAASKPAKGRRAAAANATDGVAAESEGESDEGAPRRRRGRSRATAAAEVATDGAGEGTTDVTGADDSDRLAVAGLDVIAELGARSSTAMLFQAPEGGRRRRAQAPAGPPEPDDDLEDEDEDEDEDEGVEESAEGGDDSDDEGQRDASRRRRRRRGGRGRRKPAGSESEDADEATETAEVPSGGRRRSSASASVGADEGPDDGDEAGDDESAEDETREGSRRRRRRRRSSGRGEGDRRPDEVTALKGSTRLEAKRQRRREGRDAGRRRSVLTEAEFLARRESVDRAMIVREAGGRVQIAVLEDGVLVEHFVSRAGDGHGPSTMIGNVYLGRVQNVLPSMEAAFVDIGKGRNAVLYAGEVNWDAAGLEGQPRRIEQALKSGDSVLVQVTKDPVGHKGARLTSQITLAGRYLVYVPAGGMTGISRKLPENERARLKKLLREIVPDTAGVIVRTAAEGAAEDDLRRDVKRLQDQWDAIEKRQRSASAPALLQGEPDMAIRVVRDIFNDDFASLVVQGDGIWTLLHEYVEVMAPDLVDRLSRWTGTGDVFSSHRIDEQLAKAMERKVWLPSGGSLVIDRTEAMTVVDVNTGKFTGSGGTLEETVTRNNLEAAEEIVRQLRLRDIGGIIVIDFIDMVLESNRDLVLRRLVECLGRDRTKHQVAEVTSLGLVQMTRKRVGQGLVEAFSEACQHCAGRGYLIRNEPVEVRGGEESESSGEAKRSRRKRPQASVPTAAAVPVLPEAREAVKATLATIAAAAAHAHEHEGERAVEPAAEVAEPVEEPTTEPTEEPTTESVDEPAEESVEEPATEPATEPAEERVEQAVDEPGTDVEPAVEAERGVEPD